MKKQLLSFICICLTITAYSQTVTTLAGSSLGFYDGQGAAAQFNYPRGIATDTNGNVYVADDNNHKIRKISPTGNVTTFAGSTAGYADGTGTAAQFTNPLGLATDANNNVYVCDTYNHRIRKITPNGVVTTIAGSSAGFADGTGTAALFNFPNGIVVDAAGNLYVADTWNHKIRKITPAGVVTTIAGSSNGFADGDGLTAKFAYPLGITIDSANNLYVADSSNYKIRKIAPDATVTTFAGSTQGFADGPSDQAKFQLPYGIAFDANGVMYVTDISNHKIRKITGGVVSTYCGSTAGYNDGPLASAQFNNVNGITIDSNGNFYISDVYNQKIRKISPTLGINENPLNQGLKLYPNPADNLVTVSIEAFSSESKIIISDLTGKILYSQKVAFGETTINVSNLSKGVYIVMVADGSRKASQKLIIE